MKFYIETLGCKVNTYESNVMSEELKTEGFLEVSEAEADVCILNSCTVTNGSDSKSRKVIRSMRRNNPHAIIAVVGCYSQIEKEKLLDLGVQIVIGNKGKSKIGTFIKEYVKTKQPIVYIEDLRHTDFETMILNNFNRTRAFVKIQDGCNNFCSFCIIPYARGNVRSKNPRDVMDEVKQLIKEGHHEIVLTGIHTGHYGSELKNYHFIDLLTDLVEVEGLERLRISSIELNEITDEVIKLMENNPILVDHMHIPLQSGCDKILKSMNRKYDMEYFKNRIQKIRKVRPNISITTDVIVGFPGETEEDFEETLRNIEELKFSKIHVFPYSRRKGTKADQMDNQVKEEVKKERVHRLMELSKKLEIAYMEQFLNQEVEMIPEVIKEGYLIGHTGNYLLVKAKGSGEELHKNKKVTIKEINYPYCLAE